VNLIRDLKGVIRGRRHTVVTICLAGSLLLAGCTVGPKYQRPPAEVPPAYKEVGNWKVARPNEQKLGGNWWEIFQDPQLNALEQQVNISNQNLKAAQAVYTQARALVRYNRAGYFPTLAVAPTVSRTRVSGNRPPQTSIFNGITSTDFQLPFELSYQVDAWDKYVARWSLLASRRRPAPLIWQPLT